VSTIDLFADRWVLVSGRGGNGWSDCVRRSSAARALGVEWYGIHPAGDLEDVADRFSTAYGVGTDGAVLIRPDGFIAWRHVKAADGTRALDDALERLSWRSSPKCEGTAMTRSLR
jgi:putative polyketide hydroxylase